MTSSLQIDDKDFSLGWKQNPEELITPGDPEDLFEVMPGRGFAFETSDFTIDFL